MTLGRSFGLATTFPIKLNVVSFTSKIYNHSFTYGGPISLFEYLFCSGTAVAQWLRCCATNTKVAGSIPAGVNEIFIESFRTMALGSTQPLTEMSTKEYFLGVKSGRCVRLTTLPPSCAVVTKSGNLNFLESSGPLQACNGD